MADISVSRDIEPFIKELVYSMVDAGYSPNGSCHGHTILDPTSMDYCPPWVSFEARDPSRLVGILQQTNLENKGWGVHKLLGREGFGKKGYIVNCETFCLSFLAPSEEVHILIPIYDPGEITDPKLKQWREDANLIAQQLKSP